MWTSQHGPRVAAFNVSKWCQLLCPGYGLMGLNNVTCRDVKVPVQSCYLLDPTGTVRTIDVPFHLALSDKNSKRARDMHLLKKLKVALKESPCGSGRYLSVHLFFRPSPENLFFDNPVFSPECNYLGF